MKKFGLFLAAVVAAVCVTSCLDGASSYKYTTGLNFEYSNYPDSTIFHGASYLCLKNFIYGEMSFAATVDEADSTILVGGFAYAYLQDSVFTATPEQELPDPFIMFGNDSTLIGNNHFMCYQQNADSSKNPNPAMQYLYSLNGTCTPSVVYVANTLNNVVRAESAFDTTDWAKVTFTGYKEKVKTGEASGNLFSNGQPIKSWTQVNLESLGTVDAISVDITASKEGIVDAFCMDLFMAQILIEY